MTQFEKNAQDARDKRSGDVKKFIRPQNGREDGMGWKHHPLFVSLPAVSVPDSHEYQMEGWFRTAAAA